MVMEKSLQLYDGTASALASINQALTVTNSGFRQLQLTAGPAVPVVELAAANEQLHSMGAQAEAASQQQEQLGNKLKETKPHAESLSGRIKSISSALKSIKSVTDLADGMAQTTARLNQMNDGLQSTGQLQDMVYAAAQRSRTAYLQTAETVAKLGQNAGNAFSSSAETVAFAEQLNKQFVLAGTSQDKSAAATSKLTQALATGVIRGEDFNTLMEAAPNAIQTVADYMGKPVEAVRDLATQGQLSAMVVKNALLSASNETDAQLAELPMTWSQVWSEMSNMALMALEPLLSGITWLANNLEIVGPLLLAIGITAGVFAVIANWTNICAAATNAWSAAELFLNKVWMASPLMFVIGMIVLLIGVIFAVVAAINKVCGTSFTALGIIIGAVAVAAAFIGNTVIGLLNAIIQFVWRIFVEPFITLIEFVLNVVNGGFDSFGDAVANMIGNVISWFLSLGKVVTKIIDAIFGTDWTGGLNTLQDNVLQWGKNENAITLSRDAPALDMRFSYSNAWDKGTGIGDGLTDKMGNMLNPSDNSFGWEQNTPYTDNLAETTANAMTDTAENTGQMAQTMEIAEEDLSYLRDMAEQEAINRFTTAEVKLEMVNNNTISGTQDIDGIVDYFGDRLSEMMVVAAEGGHA